MFPLETEKPIIRDLTNRLQVVDIAVSGDMDPFTLKQVTERVPDELTPIPGITQVDIVSAPPYEIWIGVSENDLRRHGLTFDQVADAVRRSSLDLPGGSVRTDGGEILLRTIGGVSRGRVRGSGAMNADRRQPPAAGRRGDRRRRPSRRRTSTPVRLRADDAALGLRTGNQSAVHIAELATQYVEGARARLPEAVTLTVWQILRVPVDVLACDLRLGDYAAGRTGRGDGVGDGEARGGRRGSAAGRI